MKEEQIRRLLVHAIETVPYYTDKLNLDYKNPSLDDFPVIYKRDLINNNEFLSSNYNRVDLKKLYTSGTTGSPLEIFKSKEDEVKSGFSLWRIRNRVYEVSPRSKKIVFHIFTRKKEKIVEQAVIKKDKYTLSFSLLSLNDEDLKNYYKNLMEFNPTWIFGPPSAIQLLAQFILKNNLPIPNNIKYIELAGEFLQEFSRKIISDCFKCNIANNYGTAESYGIALECPEGNLHCMEDNVITEVVDENEKFIKNKKGEIVITTLNNYAMPLIRYSTGDIGAIHESDCCCGNKKPILVINAGRASDYLKLEDGKQYNSSIFYYIISKLNQKLDDAIAQFQIIQKKSNMLEVNLVISENYIIREIKKLFIQEMKGLGIRSLEYSFQFPHQINPNKQTGKIQYFISELKY